MHNAKYKTSHVKSVCEKKLDIKFRASKEYNGWFILNGIKTNRITVPKGRKYIPPKTYKSMASQLKLTVEQFDDLLSCSLKYDDYIDLIKR